VEAERLAELEQLDKEQKLRDEQVEAERSAELERLEQGRKAGDDRAEAGRLAELERLDKEQKLRDEQVEAECLAELERLEQEQALDAFDHEKIVLPETANTLPRKMHVSNKVLGKVFSEELDTSKNTVFEVITVPDDSHRMFRSLSQSNVFRTRYPDLSGKVSDIRLLLHEYGLQNPNIVCRLLNVAYWPQNANKEYFDYLKTILDPENMGDHRLINLFSMRFGIHVVRVRDHQNQAEVFSTHHFAKTVYCRYMQSRKIPREMETKVIVPPSDISEVIFIWQHTNTGDLARHKGSSVHDPCTQYTLLEPLSGQHDITPQLLVLTDVFLEPLPKPLPTETKKERPWDEELKAIEEEAKQDPLFERYSPVEPKDKEEDGNPNDVNEQVKLEQSDQERFAKEEDAKAKRSEQERIAREEAAKAKWLEQEQLDNERMGTEKNFVVPRKRKPSQTMKGILEEDEQDTQYQPHLKKNKNEKCELPKTLSISNKVFHTHWKMRSPNKRNGFFHHCQPIQNI
jgi:hypothetical protein